MKRWLLKIVSFLSGHSFWKYVLFLAVACVALVVMTVVLAEEVINTAFGTVIGLIFSAIFMYFIKIFLGNIEDMSKVTEDTQKLKEIYTDENYCKTVELNGSTCEIMYNDVLVNDDLEFAVDDHPEKQYELPSFIENNYMQLIEAHGRSTIENSQTARLDDIVYENGVHTFCLSRSNFFNHLVTNRAVDFELTDGITIRDVFECGPQIPSLKDSKLSNHIGINALVFLRDDTILIPRRKNDATISKNMITSSIATRLTFPSLPSEKISREYLFHDNVIKSLTGRLKIPAEEVAKLDVDVQFLGVGQNIYEGGKPQMYFAVKIRNLDSAGYYKWQEACAQEGKIDVDKCTYLVDYASMKFVKDDAISFDYWDVKTDKKKNITLGFEKSFACNIWHFENWKYKSRML